MPNKLLNNQAIAQAMYMNALAKKAEGLVRSNLDLYEDLFDPQGRVLVDVSLDEAEIEHLVYEINQLDNNIVFSEDKHGLYQAMGRIPTVITTVSLNTSCFKNLDQNEYQLNDAFYKRVTKALREEGSNDFDDIMLIFGPSAKGSIIALQQEFHFHLALASRVYEKLPRLDGRTKEMQAAHQATMLEVNELVMQAFAKALIAAHKSGEPLKISKINKLLDKARKEITPQAHTILMKNIVAYTGVAFEKKDFKTAKKEAEKTTATANDFLELERKYNYQEEQLTERTGLATLIAGSEKTAHERVPLTPNSDFAHRRIITHPIKAGEISANKNARIQIRTPSPVIKCDDAGNKYPEGECVRDVCNKLTHIKEVYQLASQITASTIENIPIKKAFIYNSYTAFNDRLDDWGGKNLQTKSAKEILLGAHSYNKSQLDLGEEERVFCLVQNISVNGFGDSLGYSKFNDLRTETTLMAEIALLYTLSKNCEENEQEQIANILEEYTSFLQNSSGDSFFSKSEHGESAIGMIDELKKHWKKKGETSTLELDVNEKAAEKKKILENASKSLKYLMANNLHFTHEYSKLFQSLSVFVEEASIGGCKSANERHQSIAGRIAIFDKLLNSEFDELNDIEQLMCEQLAALATGKNVSSAAQRLKNTLDHEYNARYLHKVSVSPLDQGASAKVEAKPKYSPYISRNYAEDKADRMYNLHQSKAGKMQAHKGLVTAMAGAWDGYTQSTWTRMKSGRLGILGAIIGLPLFPIFMYRAHVDNKARRAKAKKIRECALEDPRVKVEGFNGSIYNIALLGAPVKRNDAPDQIELDIEKDEIKENKEVKKVRLSEDIVNNSFENSFQV